MITLIQPTDGASVSLQTAAHIAFAENSLDYAAPDFDWRNLTHTSDPDCSVPAPIVFSWQADGMAKLQISETESFADIVREVTAENTAAIYNLEIGRSYFWRVLCGETCSEIRTFETEDRAPRWIYIDGITNVRDMGGWKTVDGKQYYFRTDGTIATGRVNIDGVDRFFSSQGEEFILVNAIGRY